MAKISTYPIISLPTFNDLLIGTDVENLNETKNFTIGDIADLIIVGNYVPYIGAIDDVDLGIHSITASSFIVPGGLSTEFVKADGSLDSTVYQPAGNYITGLSGEATASGPGVSAVVLSNGAVIGKVLTGLTITGGSISSSDSVLQAFGKLQNQVNGLYGGAIYQGTWNALTNTPTLTSSVGTQGYYYIVSVAGNTVLDGISDWNVGDWAIFDGTAWQQVDNTDTVVSVNGQVGIVVLTTTDIAEGTNLYYTDTRARASLTLTTTGSSGASTYNNLTGAFNIPNYTLSGLGGVPSSRQLSINGTAYDLSADRSWSVGTVTSIGTSGPLTGGTITGSGTIGITQSGAASDGYLSSTDWNIFNNKQNALVNPVTGTGTVYYIPMWSAVTALTDSIISYSSNVVNYNYNSASGATVNYINTNGTAYTYTIQMNNTGTRQTYHSYTDGNIIQRINSNDVSRNLQSGQLVLPYYTTLGSFTGTSVGYLGFDASGNILTVSALSSVGISMPSAFTVSNSPLTSNGTIAVTGAGLASQYVRGDGTLADFPTGGGGGGASVTYYLNGSVNQGTFGGNVYYQMDKVPIIGTGTDFSRGTNGYIAQFITDVGVPNALLIPGGNWNLEFYFSASSGGGAPSFYVELYKYNGTTFTLISSNSATPETITGGTSIDAYFTSLAVPETILAATDRLAIRIYVTTVGRTITLHTENSHLCEIITTFTTGLTTLNGLTKQVQYFAVGTSGTDFNISSSVDTHTFNLPTASAVNRGALSSADWSVFNSKVGGTGATGQVAYWNGTNSQTGSNNFFWDAANARLGIGTATPSGRVHIVSTTVNDALLVITPNNNSALYPLFIGGATLTSENYLRANNSNIEFFRNGVAATIRTVGSSNNLVLQSSSDLLLNTNGANERVRIFTTTGNISLNSSTDAGYKLDVNGTARVLGTANIGNASYVSGRADLGLSVMGFVNNSAIAVTSATGTLLHIENIDQTNNSYANISLRVDATGNAVYSNISLIKTSAGTGSLRIHQQGTQQLALFTNGNLLLQNGGTFVDSGFRLDVNGTARVSGSTYLATSSGSVGIGTLFPATKFVVSNAGASGLEIDPIGGVGSGVLFQAYNRSTSAYMAQSYYALSHTFNVGSGGATRVVDITSGGNVGIGTTSPAAKLDVVGAAIFSSSVTAASFIKSGGTSSQYLMADGSTSTLTNPVTGTGTTNYLPKWTSGSAIGNSNLINDASGNLGLGVTPSAWYSASNGIAMQMNAGSLYSLYTNSFYVNQNAYLNASASWIYTSNNPASQYLQHIGNHYWSNAPSGTAGNAITFTQAMTLTSGGNLLVGTTTDNGNRLQVVGNVSANAYIANDATYGKLEFTGGTSNGVVGSFGSGLRLINFTASGSTIIQGNADININTQGSSNILFGTSALERMRITFGGNLLVGTTTDSGGRLQVSGNISVNTSGQARTISTYYATGSDGVNIWIGGGGQSSTFTAGATYQGSYNSAMGVSALIFNTTGYYNSAMGGSALYSNTTGYLNSAMGVDALYSNTTGYYNSAIGVNALYYNTTGYLNSAMGVSALISNTTGYLNSAMGVSALYSNTTGYYNSAMGVSALYSNTTGYYNSAMGVSALISNTTGNSNTALGFQAGYGTGTNANTTGSNNIFIGKESVGVSATESNRTWIGNSATTSTWVGGNLLVGTTADQGYRVQITGSGDNMLNVWGATAPSIRLDNAASGATQRFVIGLATGTNQFIQGASAGDVCITTATASPMVFGMWQTSTSEEVMRITTSKNLLINKTADGGQKLQVSGKVNFASLPTSSAGLSAGDIWNNGGVLNIV